MIFEETHEDKDGVQTRSVEIGLESCSEEYLLTVSKLEELLDVPVDVVRSLPVSIVVYRDGVRLKKADTPNYAIPEVPTGDWCIGSLWAENLCEGLQDDPDGLELSSIFNSKAGDYDNLLSPNPLGFILTQRQYDGVLSSADLPPFRQNIVSVTSKQPQSIVDSIYKYVVDMGYRLIWRNFMDEEETTIVLSSI